MTHPHREVTEHFLAGDSLADGDLVGDFVVGVTDHGAEHAVQE